MNTAFLNAPCPAGVSPAAWAIELAKRAALAERVRELLDPVNVIEQLGRIGE